MAADGGRRRDQAGRAESVVGGRQTHVGRHSTAGGVDDGRGGGRGRGRRGDVRADGRRPIGERLRRLQVVGDEHRGRRRCKDETG